MISWLKRLMRQHPVSDEELSCLVDSPAPAGRDAAVRRHVASCDACARKLDELRHTKGMLAELPQAGLPRSFVLTPQEAGLQVRMPRLGRNQRLVFAPALAFTVLVALLATDAAIIGDGSKGGESVGRGSTAYTKAVDSNSGGTSAAALDASRNAPAPAVPTADGAGASAAEKPSLAQGESTVQPATAAQSQQAQPAPADAALPRGGGETTDRTLIRTLEGIAALALAGSVAYLWYRSRPAG